MYNSQPKVNKSRGIIRKMKSFGCYKTGKKSFKDTEDMLAWKFKDFRSKSLNFGLRCRPEAGGCVRQRPVWMDPKMDRRLLGPVQPLGSWKQQISHQSC